MKSKLKLNKIQSSIIECVIRSNNMASSLKVMVLSYLFFSLVWDFPYYELCYDINSGVVDYLHYDFLQGESDVSKN